MKKILHQAIRLALLLGALIFALTQCDTDEGVDPDLNKVAKLELKVDTTQILADSIEAITLSAKALNKNNELLTGIQIDYYAGSTKLPDNIFKTATPGKYSLTAKAENITSNDITVTVNALFPELDEQEFDVESRVYSGVINLPENSQVDLLQYTVLSGLDEVKINQYNRFTLYATANLPEDILMVTNEQEELLMLTYLNGGDEELIEFNAESTTLALVLMVPSLVAQPLEIRDELIQKITNHSNFTSLLNAVTNSIRMGKDLLDPTNETLFSEINALVKDISSEDTSGGRLNDEFIMPFVFYHDKEERTVNFQNNESGHVYVVGVYKQENEKQVIESQMKPIGYGIIEPTDIVRVNFGTIINTLLSEDNIFDLSPIPPEKFIEIDDPGKYIVIIEDGYGTGAEHSANNPLNYTAKKANSLNYQRAIPLALYATFGVKIHDLQELVTQECSKTLIKALKDAVDLILLKGKESNLTFGNIVDQAKDQMENALNVIESCDNENLKLKKMGRIIVKYLNFIDRGSHGVNFINHMYDWISKESSFEFCKHTVGLHTYDCLKMTGNNEQTFSGIKNSTLEEKLEVTIVEQSRTYDFENAAQPYKIMEKPASDVAFTFEVSQGDGVLIGLDGSEIKELYIPTDNEGKATIDWKLGEEDEHEVTAHFKQLDSGDKPINMLIEGDPIIFNAKAEKGEKKIFALFTAGPQACNTPYDEPLTVQVLHANDEPYAHEEITIQKWYGVGENTYQGSADPDALQSAITDENGVAQFTISMGGDCIPASEGECLEFAGCPNSYWGGDEVKSITIYVFLGYDEENWFEESEQIEAFEFPATCTECEIPKLECVTCSPIEAEPGETVTLEAKIVSPDGTPVRANYAVYWSVEKGTGTLEDGVVDGSGLTYTLSEKEKVTMRWTLGPEEDQEVKAYYVFGSKEDIKDYQSVTFTTDYCAPVKEEDYVGVWEFRRYLGECGNECEVEGKRFGQRRVLEFKEDGSVWLIELYEPPCAIGEGEDMEPQYIGYWTIFNQRFCSSRTLQLSMGALGGHFPINEKGEVSNFNKLGGSHLCYGLFKK